MSDQVYEVEFRGKDTSFAATAREGTKAIREMKGATTELLASFTGGLIGGGIAGTVLTVVGQIKDTIADARRLFYEARGADLSTKFARGAETFSRIITDDKDPKLLGRAVANTRRARVEAMAGDEAAAADFDRLGIALKDIKDLDPAALFERVFEALKGNPDARRIEGAVGVLGAAEADALMPHIRGGRQRMRFGAIEDTYGDWFLANSSLWRAQMKEQMTAPGEWKAEMEPIAKYGIGRDSIAANLQLGARQQVLAMERASLPINEQLKQIDVERLRLAKLIRDERDPVKQGKLINRDVALDQESRALVQQRTDREIAEMSKRVSLPGVTFRVGGGLSGGGIAAGLGDGLASGSARPSFGAALGGDQSAVITLLTAQLTTAKQQLASLGALPAALAREL